MLGLTKDDARGFWAVVWRALLLMPIMWGAGIALLVGVLFVFIGLPVQCMISFIFGDWFQGLIEFAIWITALRYGRPLLRWTFQGYEWTHL